MVTAPLASRRTALLVACAAMVSAASCNVILGFDDYREGDAAGGAGGVSTGQGGATSTSTGMGGAGGGTGMGGGTTTTSSSAGGGGVGGGGNPVCGDGTVAGQEQCDDGNTMDGDGCSSTCGYELSDGCPAVALHLGSTPVTFMGDTTAASPDASSSCGGMSASDYIFLIQPTLTGMLNATLTAQYNGLVWVRDQCPNGTELACGDPNMPMPPVQVTAGVPVYVGVDGHFGANGPFMLELVIQ